MSRELTGVAGRRARRPGTARGCADAGGYVAAEFAMATAIILVPVTILALAFPIWAVRISAAHRAANESAREIVLAPCLPIGQARANQVVAETASNYGIPGDQISATYQGDLTRGGTVTATVSVWMPALPLGFFTRLAGWHQPFRHSEHVDDFRSFDAGAC
jgi:hypothetical protein